MILLEISLEFGLGLFAFFCIAGMAELIGFKSDYPDENEDRKK